MTAVIVTGNYHGGTSAVAGVVHLLGFPTHTYSGNRHQNTNEDSRFHQVGRDPKRFKKLVEEYESKYIDYCIKIPGMTLAELEWFKENVAVVKFVFVARDPVAVGSHGPEYDVTKIKNRSSAAMLKTQDHFSFSQENPNCFWVSYERLCFSVDRGEHLLCLAKFLGRSKVSDDVIISCMRYCDSSQGYRSVRDFIK